MNPIPSTLPTLFTFRRCPYAIRARLALAVAGVKVAEHEVDLKRKPAQMLACSPKGTVPVLVLASGLVIDQSVEIGQWALQQQDPDGWWPEPLRPAMAEWITRCDTTFKPLLDRYKYAVRHPELSQAAHFDKAVEAFIAPLDQCIASHGGHICDRQRRWVDAAVFPFVRQFAAVDMQRLTGAHLPALTAWLHDWQDSALFASVMQRAKPSALELPTQAAALAA